MDETIKKRLKLLEPIKDETALEISTLAKATKRVSSPVYKDVEYGKCMLWLDNGLGKSTSLIDSKCLDPKVDP